MNPATMPRRVDPRPRRRRNEWPVPAHKREAHHAHNIDRAVKGPTLPDIEPGPYETTLCFKYSDRLIKKRRMKRTVHNRSKLCLTGDQANDLVDRLGGGIAFECPSLRGHWHYTPVAVRPKDIEAQARRDEKMSGTWLDPYT